MNSIALRHIWNQLLRSILIINLKGDFLHVPDELGRHRWKMYSIHNDFRIGFNPPWACKDPTAWLNQVTKLICAEAGLLFSESCLNRTMRCLLECLNPKGGDLIRWPTPLQILDLLDNTSDTAFARKSQYAMSLKQQLDFIIANSGSTFDAVQGGFNVFDHLVRPGHCAVLDLSNTHPKIVAIIVNLIASQLLHLTLSHRVTVDTTSFVYILDEADDLVSDEAGNRYPEGHNILGTLLKAGREEGIQVILSVNSI